VAIGPVKLPSRYAGARLIGHGGMGDIYLAEDTVLGRQVAVKVLDQRFAQDPDVRKRFTREALAAAKLSGHHNIVTIFDVDECDDGRPMIVMEYLPGGTVAERAREGRIDREEALAWLEQTAAALDDAHQAGIVHRDVKPANLLLDERNEVHVGDFGIARIVDESTAGMTVAGTVLGTAGYLSPEQARGEPATHASDIYGLGVVAYELLTGGRPFEGGSSTEEAAAHIHQPVPPASDRGVGLPRSVDRVFDRALAKEGAHRYRSARELVEDLRASLQPEAQPTRIRTAPVPYSGKPMRPGPRRSMVPVLLGALALAALAAGGVVAAVMTSNDDPGGSGATQSVVTEDVTRTQEGTTVTTEVTVTEQAPTTAPETTGGGDGGGGGGGGDGGKLSYDQARELTDEATALMRQGDYEGALPLAERAYRSLRGSGDIYEAYAAYNTGKSLIELGDCDQGLKYLDASEAIQGSRSEIREARAECG
jgi:eukaryotic-like serine/threonine-protein kinase